MILVLFILLAVAIFGAGRLYHFGGPAIGGGIGGLAVVVLIVWLLAGPP